MNRARPPATTLSGGLVRVRRYALAAGLLAAVPMVPGAQVVHGVVRTQVNEMLVAGAKVSVTDSLGASLAEVLSDASGKFTVSLKTSTAFKVSVFKIGWMPSSTDWIHAARTDTLEFDLLVPGDLVMVAPVTVTGEKSFNELYYEEARRRGWKVYAPALIEAHRDRANSFSDLMRDVGVTSIRIGRSNECTRSNLTGRCLVYVLDGRPVGQYVYINPHDVYFIAVLSATESAVQWGNNAPWGAIVVYTRMGGDKKNP
jgi:hypothetical protein